MEAEHSKTCTVLYKSHTEKKTTNSKIAIQF